MINRENKMKWKIDTRERTPIIPEKWDYALRLI
jgi:hypothetical protein